MEQKGVQIRYNPQRTFKSFQNNYPGAQDVVNRRGWWPAVTQNPNAQVRAAVQLGPLLYIGGDFSSVDGNTARRTRPRPVQVQDVA